MNGLVDVNALSSDVTSGLVELSGVLVEDASRLACTAAPRGTQDPFSTVIVHGRGDYDFDPDAPGRPPPLRARVTGSARTVENDDLGRSAVQPGCDR